MEYSKYYITVSHNNIKALDACTREMVSRGIPIIRIDLLYSRFEITDEIFDEIYGK